MKILVFFGKYLLILNLMGHGSSLCGISSSTVHKIIKRVRELGEISQRNIE